MSENTPEKKPKPMRQFVQIECADCDAKAQLTLELSLRGVLGEQYCTMRVESIRIPEGWSHYAGKDNLVEQFRCLNHARAYADKHNHARSFGRDEMVLYQIGQAQHDVLVVAANVMGLMLDHGGIETERDHVKRWYRDAREHCTGYGQHILDLRMLLALEQRAPKREELRSLIRIAIGSTLDAVGEALDIKRSDESDLYGQLLECDDHYRERLAKNLDAKTSLAELTAVFDALRGAKPNSPSPDLQTAVEAAEAPRRTEYAGVDPEARVKALEGDLFAAREALLREGVERDQFRRALDFIAAAVFEPPHGTPNLPPVEERILGQIEELHSERTARKTAEHEYSEAMRVVEELFYILNHKLTRKERSAIRMLGMLREQIGDLREVVTQRVTDAKVIIQAAELIEDDRGETDTTKLLRALAKRLDPPADT